MLVANARVGLLSACRQMRGLSHAACCMHDARKIYLIRLFSISLSYELDRATAVSINISVFQLKLG